MKKLTLVTLLVVLSITMLLSGCIGKKSEEPKKEPIQSENSEEVVYLVQTPPPNMLKQLDAKEIDGFIAWEPFNTVAVQAGNADYLFKSTDIWKDHPCCVLAASADFKDNRTLEAFTWADIKATRFINDPRNKEKVIKYAAEFTGKSEEIAQMALTNITYIEYPAKDRFQEYYDSLEKDKLLKKSISDIGFTDSNKFFENFLKDSTYLDISDKINKDSNWKPEPVSNTVKLRVGYLNHDLHQLAIYVAEKEGYFQQIGLVAGKNYETKVFPNGVAVMAAFNAKDVDIAYLGGAPATLKRINDNIPIQVIAGANNEGSGLVVRKDAGIASIKDLNGKTIAIPGVGTVQYTLLERAIKDQGLRLVIK